MRLLPEALEHAIGGWGAKGLGCVLVAFAVTTWLALVSWQINDPNVADAVQRSSRNLAGSYGAALSDFLVQMFGLASVMAVICPMVWGLELLSGGQELEAVRPRFYAFPFALLALAGFASCLPSFPGWPLHSGGGGMLGDIVATLSMTSIAGFGLERSRVMAGLVLLLASGGLSLLALGLQLGHMVWISPGTAWTRSHDVSHWWDFVPASLRAAP
ncbi:MAG: DNA translocase FtsK 4TM domain-containing protein, partial [Pirellulaceae bacterium]